MSEQENIAVVQQAYNNFKTGNIQALLALLSDDVEWELPEVENVPFTGEPTRESLTQPPPGYQTPSSGYAYGITGAERARTQQQQQNQNEPRAVMSPGTY